MDDIAPAVRPSHNNRKFYGWIIFLASIVIITVVALISFSVYLENEIEKKVHLLNGRATDIDVNLIARSVKISGLELDSLSDSTTSHQRYVRLNSLFIRGLSYYELAINKKIVIRKVILENGVIRYKKVGNHPPDSVLKTGYNFFLVKDLSFINIETRVELDTNMNYAATVSGQLSGLCVSLDSVNKVSRSIEQVEAAMKNISISQKNGKYKGAIGSLHINTQEGKITFDSAWLIPMYGKYDFARKAGEQIARLSVFIPKVTVAGIKFNEIKDSALVASKIEITAFELFSFKDKRLPFLRKRNIPLPMAGFLKLPYRIQVDSVIIKNSNIMIEEYPEKGSEPYEIDIKEVSATITGLSNRTDKAMNTNVEMVASGLLLNTGKIKALFKFPLDGSSTYSAQGTIAKIPFTQLNPILKVVDVRVESGYLNSLTFSFDYTEFNSKGVLEINYEDLRIISLDRNKTTTNEIRTVLINMFVKNSKNQFKSASTQTGIIDIERDRKRYIFNVWVKSILAGVKSSVVGGNPRQRNQKK